MLRLTSADLDLAHAGLDLANYGFGETVLKFEDFALGTCKRF